MHKTGNSKVGGSDRREKNGNGKKSPDLGQSYFPVSASLEEECFRLLHNF